jgi:hypothetical protein
MAATVKEERVFITNYAGHNYDGARKYGRLISITRGYVSFGSIDRVKFNITKKIVEESHAEDWMCLSGVPVISAIAAAVWLRHHGKLKLLVWDKKTDSQYREVIIDENNYNDMIREICDAA